MSIRPANYHATMDVNEQLEHFGSAEAKAARDAFFDVLEEVAYDWAAQVKLDAAFAAVLAVYSPLYQS